MSDRLSMRGVWKGYRAGVRGCSAVVSVLRDVHLDVSAGEVVGVVAGPSAGKTTLLLCAAGLLRVDQGSVSWFGAPPRRDVSARPDGIAYAGDRPFPYGFLSVREALEYAAIVRDLPLRDSAARVTAALARTGLAALADRRVDSLDGAALGRLSLAGALLAQPRLLLVDDLPVACDVGAAREIAALLRAVAAEGAAVVVAGRLTSFLAMADELRAPATRTFVLAAGRLEPTADATRVTARRAEAVLPRARVAEAPHPSAARENQGR
jgi:ABC-2 type transport system ATP-binding protein